MMTTKTAGKRRNLDDAPVAFDRLASRPIYDDVPGVTARQIAGKAPGDVPGEAQDGLILTLDRGQNDPIPAPQAATSNAPHAVKIRLPKTTWSRIEAVIEKRGSGQSINAAVGEAVADWLAKHGG